MTESNKNPSKKKFDEYKEFSEQMDSIIDDKKPLKVKTNYHIGKKILFSLIILFIFFLLAEIITRLLGGKSFPKIHFADSNYEVEWELKKNYAGEYWWPRINPDGSETKIIIRTNSFGLRGEDFPIVKPKEEYRILFLGDSVVFGMKLNEDETLPKKIEEKLSDWLSDKKLKVINGGVEGWTTFQEYYFLKRRGFELSPDFVILGFILNDIFEPHITTKTRGGSGNFAMLAGQKSFSRSLLRLACKSAFFTKIFFKYAEISNREIIEKRKKEDVNYRSVWEIYDENRLFDEPLTREIETAWQEVEGDLLNIKKLTDEQNVPFAIVVFPFAGQVVDKKWSFKPQERLKKFCSDNNINLIDISYAYMVHPNPVELYLAKDGIHLSPKGAEYIGKILAEEIKRIVNKEGIISNKKFN